MGKKAMVNILDGKTFHELTVLHRAENDMWDAARWLVKCSCGTEKVVRGSALVLGNVKSCGCKARGKLMPKGKGGRFVRLT